MMRTATNPMARDPEVLELFRTRVDHRDWTRAKRLAYVLGLHRETPQKLMERDDVYLRRLERRYALRRQRPRRSSR
jgi:hypothetical protein